MQLQGKTAVVTGGSHGLGFRIAEMYASSGARVLICGRNQASVESAQQKLRSLAAGKVCGLCADVSQAADVKRLADFAR